MTNITGSLIDLDISKIFENNNPRTNNVNYDVIVHTPDEDIEIQFVKTVEIMRDYNGNLTDYVVVNIACGAGDFIKGIYPYRDNCEISVLRTSTLDYLDRAYRYKMILLNNNGAVKASKYLTKTRDQLNAEEQFHLEIQCLPLELEILRSTFVDGIYKNSSVKDVIVSEFYQGTQHITGTKSSTEESKVRIGSDPRDIEVDITEPHNDYTYNHIGVPSGTKLTDLPFYLQDTNYGVYNGSIGAYLQEYQDTLYFFIYPLYNTSLFDTRVKKLIIYYTSNTRLAMVENTYTVEGDVVKILANSDVKIIDSGENDFMNSGSGLIASNPKLLMERNVNVTDTTINFSSDAHITGTKIKNRRDQVDRMQYVQNESNMYKQRSAIIKNTMALYQITWHFSDIELLYPGMPVMYTYDDEIDGVIELHGLVQSVYARYNEATKTTSAILNIAVEKPNINKE